ncbi:nitrilase-related carbon-nitrogen hydrolase [Actinacidiphila acidipaludis]|uniref:Nitrilase n=1 Tax=Actinacidiphila acidipaludis TaxID=2873382 RepID=A0ABS7QA07_9ACTN|nr:nitrilase-related carbon-nitrogen hydrolase [Streptomyces acidipaludis]MBY8879951.1 nitrilase [Streptomyces acidipaludis]
MTRLPNALGAQASPTAAARRDTTTAGNPPDGPGRPAPAVRPLLLLLGTGTMLFAVGGRWDIAAAAWIFPVLLLRYTRLSRVATGALGIWAAHIAAAFFWIQESAIGLGPVTAVGAAALAAVQTLPFLADGLLAGRLRPALAACVFPSAVAGAEFLIGVVSPFGTAYGSLAVTQYGDLPLLQVVSVTGSWGIGFLIAYFASTVNRIWERPSWRPGLAYGALVTAVVLAGGARLAFSPASVTTVRVAGISPGRAVTAQLTTALGRISGGSAGVAAAPAPAVQPAMTAVENDLLASTRREAAAGAKIVVWPEEAVKTQESHETAAIAEAQDQARSSGIYLEVGLRVYSTTGPAYGKDEAVLVDPRGKVLWTYQKAHPIPGSEKFTPGDGRVPVADTPYGRLADVICYDADFPAMMRTRTDIMLVPSHDWKAYGGAHTMKASLRAIEGGYAVVRQDADGVSTAYDDKGRVLASTDSFTTDRQTMVAYVPTRGTTTVYDRIGDLFAWLCLAAVGALAVTALVRRRHPASPVPVTGTGQAAD